MNQRFMMLIASFLFGLIGLFAWIQVGETAVQSTICYVDQNIVGLDNGTSWDDAYTSLQIAMQVVMKF